MTTRKPNEAERFEAATRGAEAVGRSADALCEAKQGRCEMSESVETTEICGKPWPLWGTCRKCGHRLFGIGFRPDLKCVNGDVPWPHDCGGEYERTFVNEEAWRIRNADLEAGADEPDAAVAIRTGRWIAEWKDGWRVVKVAAVGLTKEDAEELAASANAIERIPMP